MGISTLKEKFNSLTLESEDHWDYRGNTNSERDYVHNFCTYPAMMVPKMQREMLDVCLENLQVSVPCLLDPFAGSGTILVEGMLRGLNVVGLDINPLAILLCKTKTTILSPVLLTKKTTRLINRITNHNEIQLHQFKGINKWFTARAISDLSIIRSAIISEEIIEYRRFFWATFCEVVRIVSNSRDCTYKLHIKNQNEIDSYDKDAISEFKNSFFYNRDILSKVISGEFTLSETAAKDFLQTYNKEFPNVHTCFKEGISLVEEDVCVFPDIKAPISSDAGALNSTKVSIFNDPGDFECEIYEFALDRNLIDYMYNNISYNNLIDRDEYCNDTAISFPVRRICRLNELTTIDIIKEYGIMLSRIGQPFDFYK